MSSDVEKMVLSALARHGPMGASLLANYVETSEAEAAAAAEKLRKAGRVEVVAGKKTKRYKIREAVGGGP